MEIEKVIVDALAGRSVDALLLGLVLVWLAKIAWPQLMKQQRELFGSLQQSHHEDWQQVPRGPGPPGGAVRDTQPCFPDPNPDGQGHGVQGRGTGSKTDYRQRHQPLTLLTLRRIEMRNWLMKIAFSLIWAVTGKLGKDLARWIDEAERKGLKDRQAFDFVWRAAKAHYSDIGDWLLNLLIETVLGKKFADGGKLLKKLRWPKGL